MKKIFNYESGQVLAQVAQKGFGVYILGDTKNLTGDGLALADPCWTRCSPEVPCNLSCSVTWLNVNLQTLSLLSKSIISVKESQTTWSI